MLHRIIGLILGGLTIWVILTLGETFTPDTQPRYIAAIIIGLLVVVLYPWLIGIWVVRRAKDRREEEIQAEVQRQLAEERSRQNLG
jgi:Sec-independent protein secretion pathway component TatC